MLDEPDLYVRSVFSIIGRAVYLSSHQVCLSPEQGFRSPLGTRPAWHA
jgi:hypothetical protein